MLKSFVLICVSFLFFVSCGEDCPVDVDDRIIVRPKQCEKFVVNKTFFSSQMRIDDYYSKLDYYSSNYLPDSDEFKIALINSEWEKIQKFIISFGNENIYTIEFTPEEMQIENEQFSKYSSPFNIYRCKKNILNNGNNYETLFFISYYITTNQFNKKIPIIQELAFSMGRKSFDNEFDDSKAYQFLSFYLGDTKIIKLDIEYKECLDK